MTSAAIVADGWSRVWGNEERDNYIKLCTDCKGTSHCSELTAVTRFQLPLKPKNNRWWSREERLGKTAPKVPCYRDGYVWTHGRVHDVTGKPCMSDGRWSSVEPRRASASSRCRVSSSNWGTFSSDIARHADEPLHKVQTAARASISQDFF